MELLKVTRRRGLPEPVPLFDAIGRVAFESAGLERAYSELVATMALGGLSNFFTKGVAPAQLQQVVEPLLNNEHIPEPLRSQAHGVLRRADQLLELRNHVIHGQWLAIADELGVAQYSTHRPKRYAISDRSREWTIPELHRLARG
jgi:FixJ family two-component response regulator